MPANDGSPAAESPASMLAGAASWGPSRPIVGAGVAFIAGVLVTAMRRPNQYSWAGLWNEEGIFVLPQWLAEGVTSIFHDINGTHPFLTRALLGLNLELFPRHWPQANAVVAAMVVGLVAAVVVAAPTVLRGRWLILLFVLLIPTDAEVFGVLLYSFWWLSLLSLISVLWDPKSGRMALRVSLGWIGALSSPVGALFGLLGFVRYGFTRDRNDLRAVLFTLPASLVTLLLAATSSTLSTVPGPLGGWGEAAHTARAILGKFVGAWVASPGGFDDVTWVHALVGILGVAVIVWAVVVRPREWALWVLGIGLVGATAASILRAPLPLLLPIVRGPRYFFFAYVLLSMLLVQIATSATRSGRDVPPRVGAGLLIAAALVNIAILTTTNGLGSAELPEYVGFRRYHVAYDWGEQLAACAAGNGIGVFHDGAEIAHVILIPAEHCVDLGG